MRAQIMYMYSNNGSANLIEDIFGNRDYKLTRSNIF